MNLKYIILRIIRHFMPERIVRALLLRGWVIKPASETRNIKFAVDRYVEALASADLSIFAKRILVLGYGGRFDIANELLMRGAAHVVLADPFAPPDDRHNARLFGTSSYFQLSNDKLRPRPEFVTLITTDICKANIDLLDIVLSNSVFEHLVEVDRICGALAALTKPDGAHVHIIDLRDHYFRYPFEMLRFSPWVWRNLLNPSSNHNRLRLWDHRQIFSKHFGEVMIQVIERQAAQFEKAKKYIRPEFVRDSEDDAVTQVRVLATKARCSKLLPLN